MKKYFLFFTAIILINSLLTAQPSNDNFRPFRFGFGFGIGFFGPQDISDYIEADLKINHGAYSTWNTTLYMNLVGSVAMTYSPSQKIDIVGTCEYAWGPKYVTGIDEYYHFDRVSVGGLCNYNIPIMSGRHALFFGGGLLYHYMTFKEFNSGTVGPRIQAGVNFRFGKLNPQVCLSFDYAVANAEKTETYTYYSWNYTQTSKIKLNYSGILLNIKLNI